VLKGAIDHVTPSEVGGWMYSEAASVRDRTVLAFLGDACIGAGRVELFRADLADAGLGDGYLGFRFPVNLASPDDAGRVVVKLEGSDALILQPRVRLHVPQAAPPPSVVTTRTLASVEWMRTRGWLEQAEYDFLRLMMRFGVYDLSLRQGTPEERRRGTGLRDPAQATRELFELLCMSHPKIAIETLSSETDIRSLLDQYHRGAIEPMVSLWGPQPGVVAVVEGSHQDGAEGTNDNGAGAVDYSVGPDRILFVDLRGRLTGKFTGQVRSYAISLEQP
jgi:hypothetical protein